MKRWVAAAWVAVAAATHAFPRAARADAGSDLLQSPLGATFVFEGFKELLWHRLQDYGSGTGWKWGELDRAHFALIRELDPKLSGAKAQVIAFQGEVRSLAVDPAAKRWLSELRAAFMRGPVDLWAFTLERAGGADEATRWIAVLLQDPKEREHLSLVADPAVRNDLEYVFGRLQQDSRLSLYPPELGEVERDALYHYYVPAHLAAKLRAAGLQPAAAYLAALTFNTEYELLWDQLYDFMGEADHASALDKLAFLREAWDGPRAPLTELRMPPDVLEEGLWDLYLGYRGALAGAGEPAEPMAFADFASAISADPRGFMRALFAAARPGS